MSYEIGARYSTTYNNSCGWGTKQKTNHGAKVCMDSRYNISSTNIGSPCRNAKISRRALALIVK